MVTGLFHGFPISSSSSRTPVAESAGARTQLTGVVAAAAMVTLALAAPAVFRHMPDATLAAIVVAAALSLIDLPALRHLFRVRRSEFVLAIAAILSVAILGPVSGAVVAVTLSVLNFLRLAWKPHTAELVRVDGLKGYHDRGRHPEGRTIPGLLLYRFDAPLFFANARFFATDLARRIAERDDTITTVIVTAEPITDVDATAAEMLRDLLAELRERGIDLRFAELKGTVHERVDAYLDFHGPMPDHTARTTGEAVRSYLRTSGVSWVDWEDRAP
jgi:MFS superfamily sulfate permease-like transporter